MCVDGHHDKGPAPPKDSTTDPNASAPMLLDLHQAVLELIVGHSSLHGSLGALMLACRQLRWLVLQTADTLTLDTHHLKLFDQSLTEVQAVVGRPRQLELRIRASSSRAVQRLSDVVQMLVGLGRPTGPSVHALALEGPPNGKHLYSLPLSLGLAFPAITRLHLQGAWSIPTDPPSSFWSTLSACTRLTHLVLGEGVQVECAGASQASVDAIRLGLPHLRSLSAEFVSRESTELLVEALGPLLTSLSFYTAPPTPRFVAALAACSRLRRLRLHSLGADAMAALCALPTLTHITCDRWGVKASEAERVSSLTCGWEVVDVLCGPQDVCDHMMTTAMPRGVQTLTLHCDEGCGTVLELLPTAAASEAAADGFACRLLACARRVQWQGDALSLHLTDVTDPPLNPEPEEAVEGVLRGLAPLSQCNIHHLFMTCDSYLVPIGAAHVEALGAAFGHTLASLSLSNDFWVQPDAWEVLGTALPCLTHLTVCVSEEMSEGSGSDTGGGSSEEGDAGADAALWLMISAGYEAAAHLGHGHGIGAGHTQGAMAPTFEALLKLCSQRQQQGRALEVTVVGGREAGRQVDALRPCLEGSQVGVRHRWQ